QSGRIDAVDVYVAQSGKHPIERVLVRGQKIVIAEFAVGGSAAGCLEERQRRERIFLDVGIDRGAKIVGGRDVHTHLAVLGAVGFVHQHEGSVVFDGNCGEGGTLVRRRNDDLGKLVQGVADRLIRNQVDAVSPGRILLTDQYINVRTSFV